LIVRTNASAIPLLCGLSIGVVLGSSPTSRAKLRVSPAMFGDHSSRFFDMARYSAAKIIVRYHIGEPNEVHLTWPPLRILNDIFNLGSR
jgi:hypothetical protein